MLSSRAIVTFLTFLSSTGSVVAAATSHDEAPVIQNLDLMGHFRSWMENHGKRIE